MTTVSSVTPSNVNGYTTLTTSANPVAHTTDSGLAQAAVNLSAEGSIVATLGGGNASSLTYNAAGFLNAFVQAGTAPTSSQTPGKSSNPQATVQNLTDQGIVSSFSSNSTVSGVYNASGLLQGLTSDTSANWVTALKANPGLSSTVISDSFNQGIVGTLTTTV